MIHRVVVPDLGATGTEMVLSEWLVKPNDFVKTGTPLFAVTTDKADMEVEAYRDGYIREILVPVGTSVPCGSVVAIMTDSLEEALVTGSSGGAIEVAEPRADRPLGGVNVQESRTEAPGPSSGEMAEVAEPIAEDKSVENSRGALASPAARRMAQEMRIELGLVQGRGEGGVIHKRDVLNAAIRRRDHTSPTGFEIPAGLAARRTPLSPMRRAIAERTKRSKANAPHFYATAAIDVTDALEFLKQAAAHAQEKRQAKPSLTDLSLRATALALRLTPQLNASFQGDEIVYFEDVNIGLVVGLPDGMIVPVVAHADRKDLNTIAATRRHLQERARTGKLSTEELRGSTFTVSNLGMYGVDSFVAVINPPEAAILALGAVRKRPAVWEGGIVPREEMTVTLSADHRLVDGVVAARFLNEFKRLMENPLRATLDSHPV